MNHIYRIVFSRSQGILQAVSENARGQGKGSRGLKPAAHRRSPSGFFKAATLVMALAGISSVQLAWPQSTMAFDGGQAFTVAGASIARNAALVELGADLAISRNATVGLNYSGQYGGGNREHGGSFNVRWRY